LGLDQVLQLAHHVLELAQVLLGGVVRGGLLAGDDLWVDVILAVLAVARQLLLEAGEDDALVLGSDRGLEAVEQLQQAAVQGVGVLDRNLDLLGADRAEQLQRVLADALQVVLDVAQRREGLELPLVDDGDALTEVAELADAVPADGGGDQAEGPEPDHHLGEGAEVSEPSHEEYSGAPAPLLGGSAEARPPGTASPSSGVTILSRSRMSSRRSVSG